MKKRQTITLKGFAARDENGLLCFFPGDVKPKRFNGVWLGGDIPEKYFAFPQEYFDDISWEDEPREGIMTMHLDLEQN